MEMNKKTIRYIFGGFCFLLLFYFLFLLLFSAPGNFPVGGIVKISPGMNLRSVSSLLEKEHIIRSRTTFEAFMIIFGDEKHIISADYYFENKLTVWQVAERIGAGEHHIAPVVITIPEGFDLNQIADVCAPLLSNFNKVAFLQEAKEGYLFPDTYFFLITANEIDVIDSMSENFTKKITPLLPEILSSEKNTKRTEQDIITMASIIEREAKGDADRAIISGILWKRLSIGMPLQVDSAPETYKARGLPKTPISNPGLLAIEAAIHPESSPYLYYLHDKSGTIHYAKTFAEHQLNEQEYLK